MAERAAGPTTILVTGAGGQVGHALLQTLPRLGRVVAVDKTLPPPAPGVAATHAVDLLDRSALVALVRTVRPQVIINPAAYTAVDKAESEATVASAINAEAAGTLAEEAARLGAAFVHYSTDYVFDGSGTTPRAEDALVAPLNIYGRTKLDGEGAVLAAHPTAVVLRTSWVFSDHGHNFVKTMLRLGAEREELKVVADQIGAPTSAAFLAAMTARVLEAGADAAPGGGDRRGIYHLCCAGETSWHGFAVATFRMARQAGVPLKVREVLPITTAEYPTPARRPLNSRLDCRRFMDAFGVAALARWEDELAQVLQRLTGSACLSP